LILRPVRSLGFFLSFVRSRSFRLRYAFCTPFGLDFVFSSFCSVRFCSRFVFVSGSFRFVLISFYRFLLFLFVSFSRSLFCSFRFRFVSFLFCVFCSAFYLFSHSTSLFPALSAFHAFLRSRFRSFSRFFSVLFLVSGFVSFSVSLVSASIYIVLAHRFLLRSVFLTSLNTVGFMVLVLMVLILLLHCFIVLAVLVLLPTKQQP